MSTTTNDKQKQSLWPRLNMQSADILAENIAKIGALFPNCLTERKNERGEVERAIDFDLLRQELSGSIVEGTEERYRFEWPDKKQAMLLAHTPVNKTLRPCEKESVGRDGTPGGFDSKNLYIEGDNLEVLKLLRETYLGKVKMIYIDPPYNTGNDSVFKDDFRQNTAEYAENSSQKDEDGSRLVINSESSGRFHTDWLNMMYPRLRAAKDLLSDDGVIFISIDDNEVDNLRKICDEIFGEENYSATFIWTKTSTPPSLSYKCRKTVEYILVYEKLKSNIKYYGSNLEGGDVPLLNKGNPIKTLLFPSKSINFLFETDNIILPGNKNKLYLLDILQIHNGWNQNPIRLRGEFKWDQSKLDEEIFNGTHFLIKTSNYSIRFQRKNLEDSFKTPTNFLNIELNKSSGVDTNEFAVKELTKLSLNEYFDYAKPLSLIKSLINMICKNAQNSLILDFFSGSATTAHAVMQLNAEDGGRRRFIMVQLQEECKPESEAFKAGYKNICEIGKERIRRAGKKIKEENAGKEGIDDLDIGFRVLKCDSSNMKDVYYAPGEYSSDLFNDLADNIKEDRTPQDLLFQAMLELGAPLDSKISVAEIAGRRVFNVADNYLLACFDENVTAEVITAIASLQPDYFVMRDSSLTDDSVAVNFEQIFKQHSPNTKKKVL